LGEPLSNTQAPSPEPALGSNAAYQQPVTPTVPRVASAPAYVTPTASESFPSGVAQVSGPAVAPAAAGPPPSAEPTRLANVLAAAAVGPPRRVGDSMIRAAIATRTAVASTYYDDDIDSVVARAADRAAAAHQVGDDGHGGGDASAATAATLPAIPKLDLAAGDPPVAIDVGPPGNAALSSVPGVLQRTPSVRMQIGVLPAAQLVTRLPSLYSNSRPWLANVEALWRGSTWVAARRRCVGPLLSESLLA
jgi:hypothetical protein